MTKAIENLLRPDVVAVFDCDGVLCVYEMGEHNHVAVSNDKWADYIEKEHPYDTAMPVSQIQKFVCDKGTDKVYVCSKAFTDEERRQKLNFVMREYGISESHVKFVETADEKIDYLKQIANEVCNGEENRVAMIEDTVATIDAIYENSDFLTIHVSSFFSYATLVQPEREELLRELRNQSSRYRRRACDARNKNPDMKCHMYEKFESKAMSYEFALQQAEGRRA
jgi:hypothetical protein